MSFSIFNKTRSDNKPTQIKTPPNRTDIENVESLENTDEDIVEDIVESVEDSSNSTDETSTATRALPIEDNDEVKLPPEPDLDPLVYGTVGGVSYWGFSQRGESHILNGAPCQDRCVIDVVDSSPLIVAAIADGVGSCMLSHYGAAKATRSSVSFLKKELIKHRRKLDDAFVGDLLRAAMKCAYEAVRNEAEEMEQLEYSFQSTLTLAIYDGSTLFFSHAGDDGIVAILNDGTMDLATVRKKGEEASSVMPLQSMDWETRKSTNVNAFIMATDGVLDAFVRGEKEGNRIYYPFIEPAVKPGQISDKNVKEVADFYYKYMESPEYRSKVTDDLTMVVVTNQRKITENNLPKFDQTTWDKFSAEREAQIKAALYPANNSTNKQKKEEYGLSHSSTKWGTGRASSSCDSEMDYCRYCGKRIMLVNANYCPNCGHLKTLSNPNNSYSSNSAYGYNSQSSTSYGQSAHGNSPYGNKSQGSSSSEDSKYGNVSQNKSRKRESDYEESEFKNSEHGRTEPKESQKEIQVPNITPRNKGQDSASDSYEKSSKKNEYPSSRRSCRMNDDYSDEDRWESGLDPISLLFGVIFMVMIAALFTMLH